MEKIKIEYPLLKSKVFLETWINIVPLLNYPILAFHLSKHFSFARSKTNILSYRIYKSLEKIKRKKRIYESRYTFEKKDGQEYKTIERIDISRRLVQARSQSRGKLLVLRGRFELSRRLGATKLQPLNARNSRKSQSSGHRSMVHCWPSTRAGARCEHENTGISISHKTITAD